MSENNEDKPTAVFSSLNYRVQLLKSYVLTGSIQLPPPLLPQEDNFSALGSISVSLIVLISSVAKLPSISSLAASFLQYIIRLLFALRNKLICNSAVRLGKQCFPKSVSQITEAKVLFETEKL